MHSAPGQAGFPTTRWTLIASAGDVRDPDNRRALESLCAAYWYPLYAFVRRRGDSPEQAQDHTQDFFARILEHGYVTSTGQTTETACPAGDTTLATGSTSASACVATATYKFSGYLFSDVNPPRVNTGIAGLPFPLVWQLRGANNAIVSTLSAVTSVTYKATSCTAFTTSPAGALTAASDGPLLFVPVLNVYEYTWATPKSAGCYTVFLTLQGGQVFPAYFNVRAK